MTEDEIWAVLLRFHREVFLPDFERILSERITDGFGSLRRGMDDEFAKLNSRLDRIVGTS